VLNWLAEIYMGLFKWLHEHGHKPVKPEEYGPGQHVALVQTIERTWISVDLDADAAEVVDAEPVPPDLITVGDGGF
jgi:hypothetical protein